MKGNKANPKKKGPKCTTGWQLYVHENMASVKGDASIKYGDRLKELGITWAAIGEDAQKAFTEKAKSWVNPKKTVKQN